MNIGFLEDDRAIAALYRATFAKLGFASSGFCSIASFIAGLQKETFDLLILDWVLPDGNADSANTWVRKNRIAIAGEKIALTQKEFDLAYYLFENVGKLVSRIQLLHKVWGQAGDIDSRTIDAHVSKIKKKLRILP